jgi:hypothetical protein
MIVVDGVVEVGREVVAWWEYSGALVVALGPSCQVCKRATLACVDCEYSENLTNITAALTTPPSQIHNGSRSRSPRGYALCVSVHRSILCATKLPNRQKTQWVLIFAQIPLSTYLKQYKVGDIVDVVANGTQPPK